MFPKKFFVYILFFQQIFNFALFPQTIEPKFDWIPAVLPNCVFQDTYGFIWIGDQDGLIRYDGYNKKRYRQIPFDSTSLSADYINDIKEDGKGNLWIATRGGGLNYFNQRTRKFTHYRHNPEELPSLGSNTIEKIIVNNDGSLWLSTWDNGFTHMGWDSAGQPIYQQFTIPNLPPEIPWLIILDIYKDNQGYLWLGTAGMGLQRFNPATNEFKGYKHNPKNPCSISNSFVSSICEDDSGNMVIGTGFIVLNIGGGLNIFNRHSEIFTHFRHDPADPFSLGTDIIRSVFIDKENILWIGTWMSGLYSVPLREILNNSKPHFKYYNNLGKKSITSLYEDNQKNIWISSRAYYAIKYDRQQNPFVHFKPLRNNPNSIGDWGIGSIYTDTAGNIWFGNYRTGVTKYNPISNTYKQYYHKPNNPNSLSGNCINAICEDNYGNMWIGTEESGINILSPEDDTFSHIKVDANNPTGLSSNYIRFLLKSKNGDIWVVNNEGDLQQFDTKNKRFFKVDLNPKSTEDREIKSLIEDRDGKLWLGTRNGLYGYEIENGQIVNAEHYIHNSRDKQSISNNFIYDIFQPQVYDTSALWLATHGGLNRFDLQKRTFSHITEKDGLPSNYILQVLEDRSGNIWCSTIDGLSRYNPKTKELKIYSHQDGVPANTFGVPYANTAVGKNGQLYFGGGKGVVAFSPEKIKDNSNIPPIRITDFKIFHESVPLDTAIQFKKLITLNHNQNAFSFEFVALNFTNQAKNQYAYKMIGLHDDWIYTSTDRSASFTNLDPGDYEFKAKGSNNHGLWNEEGTSVRITILPPWWRTYWAYFLYVLALSAILYALRRYDLNRQQLKHELASEHTHNQKLQEIDKIKSRFFANISHEFRTPLTLILGPIDKLLSKSMDNDTKNELSIMQRSAKRLQRLINQLLDLSKFESGEMTLHLEEVNIIELIKQYVQSFESLAKRKNIKLEFNSGIDTHISLFDTDKIEKILNNLLSNAFKFTPDGGEIVVVVSRTSLFPLPNGIPPLFPPLLRGDLGGIQIKISDTGIGIPSNRIDKVFNRFYQVDDSIQRDNEGTGIGLALTKELVELHGGNITVQSEVGNGTTFIVLLPLGTPQISPLNKGGLRGGSDSDTTRFPAKIKNPIVPCSQIPIIDEKNLVQAPVSGLQFPMVLIVEDNSDMRAYIRGHLEVDYQIIEAQNGLSGFEKAVEKIPDLIISDVMMPKMDGYQLSEKLKTDERTSHIPVILLTARADMQDRINGLETGADDYLVKPFEAKELQVRVKNLIEQRIKLRQRFFKEIVLDSKEISIGSLDEQFIKRLFDICQQHLAEPDFNVNILGKEAGMSRSQLHRKLKGLTDKSATEFIKTLRLKRAALLIMEDHDNISKIAYDVGFNNLSYFNRSFKELFGMTPSDYLHNKKPD